MTILESIEERFSDEEIFFIEGFDEAIIGIEESTKRLIYSFCKCLNILNRQGMPQDEALDHFYCNIQGTYIGEKTAIFCFDDFNNI